MKKNFRVRDAREFKTILNSSKVYKNSAFILKYVENNLNQMRVGISSPKKIGCAVRRNKIRRQVRGMLKELSTFTTCLDVVVVVRNNYLENNYTKNKSLLNELLLRIGGK